LDGLEYYNAMGLLWKELGKVESSVKTAYNNTKDVLTNAGQATGNYIVNSKISLETKSSIGLQAGFKIDIQAGSTDVGKLKAEAKINLASIVITNAKPTANKDGYKDETRSIGDGLNIEQEISAGVQGSSFVKVKTGVKQEFTGSACPGCSVGTGSHNNKTTVSSELKLGNLVSLGRENVNHTGRYDEKGNQLPNINENNTTIKPDIGNILGINVDAAIIFGVKIEFKITIPDKK
jgi:hypothetical protein